MNPTGKKFISLFLVFSLVTLSVNLYAKERRGAKLIIIKKDGTQFQGELIAVKPTSLLLVNTGGKDVSVDIVDIKVIRVKKKSKVLQGLGLGLLFGAGWGALLGFASGGDPSAYIGKTAGTAALVWGILFGAIGFLVGGTLGFAWGIDKTILVEGMTDLEISDTLDYLRKQARVRDYK